MRIESLEVREAAGASSFDLTCEAAAKACSAAGPVDLVVWAGTFREQRRLDPAEAPFFQRALDLKGALSFDVLGLGEALTVSRSLLQTGAACRALLLVSDAQTGVCGATAGAMVLSSGQPGFVRIERRRFTEYQGRFEAWLSTAEPGGAIAIADPAGYREACVDAATRALAAADGRAPFGRDAVLATDPAIAPDLERATGWVAPRGLLRGRAFGAAPLFSFKAALTPRPKRIVLVAIVPSIEVTVALYEVGDGS